mmetsp:Transcript_36867/g.105639  ORF Transcript_36867/g.105639 Transcript_36867/m.105639 type:complete len:168 (+) Transcript_36867:382-885(+)
MVAGQPPFAEALQRFTAWMIQNRLAAPAVPQDSSEEEEITPTVPPLRSVFVTCGDWDLKTMLPAQCAVSGVEVPLAMRTWINIKKVASHCFSRRIDGMPALLQRCGLSLEGRHHSGIDDAINIARCWVHLIKTYPELRTAEGIAPWLTRNTAMVAPPGAEGSQGKIA